MSKELLTLLNDEIGKAAKAKERLKTSFGKCKVIGAKDDYNDLLIHSFISNS